MNGSDANNNNNIIIGPQEGSFIHVNGSDANNKIIDNTDKLDPALR